MIKIRKGQAPGHLQRAAFHERFMQSFQDPNFASEGEALARIEAIAGHNYMDSRKAPVTRKGGAGFADPEYPISVEWLEPYATSHDVLDADRDFQKEARNVSRAVAHAVTELRAGHLKPPDSGLKPPRPK